MYAGYIYKFTLIPTNKIYVGKHNHAEFDPTYWGSGKEWKEAIASYSKKDILREVLEWVSDLSQLNCREEYWIKKLDATNPAVGYNLSELAFGLLNHSEATCKKISESNKTKRWMYKEAQLTFANPLRIPKLLKEGWQFGKGSNYDKSKYSDPERNQKLSDKLAGRVFYTNLIKNVRLTPSQIPEYEAKGFIKGFSRDGKLVSPHVITNGREERKIQHSKLDIMLNRGWVLGSLSDFSSLELENIYNIFCQLHDEKEYNKATQASIRRLGVTVDISTRIKISETLRGHELSEDEKLEFIERLEFKELPREARRAKSLEKHRRICASAEHKKHLSDAHLGLQKGSIWINNGIINKRVMPEDFENIYIHEGFEKGRLKNGIK